MARRVEVAPRAGALAVALALSLPTSASAFAPEAAPEGAAATTTSAQGPKVDLDLSGLEPIDPSVRADLAKQIHAALEPVVRAHGLPAEKIHLDVEWRDADVFEYLVEVVLDGHGVMAERKHGMSTGPDTEQGELAEVVAAGLERYLGEWEESRASEEERLATRDPGPTPTPVDAPPSDVPRPRALGRVGWTGVALLIAGAGAVATGGALLGVGETPEPDAATKLRDWKPAGYGLLASGGALVVTGIVLVVVDAVPRARARRSGRSNATFTPVLGPRHAGVRLRVRF